MHVLSKATKTMKLSQLFKGVVFLGLLLLFLGWICKTSSVANTDASDINDNEPHKNTKQGTHSGIGEVAIHCPHENTDYFLSKCKKRWKSLNEGDVTALVAENIHDSPPFFSPQIPYRYTREKKIIWDIKKGAIQVNGKVVGVDLSNLNESEAIALVRKHCNKIQTVIWASVNSIDRRLIKEIEGCSPKYLVLNLEKYHGSTQNLNNLNTFSKKLIFLSLDKASIAGKGLKHLTKLSTLEGLRLGKTQIKDGGLRYLSNLSLLKSLVLHRTRIGDKGLAHLSSLKNLRTLNLGRTRIGDKGLAHLSSLKNLRTLNLGRTRISDKGLAHLSSLKNLRTLDLSRTQVNDRGLKHLAGLSNLRELNLLRTRISDKGLAHLSSLKNLRTLNLSRTRISDKGLAHLSSLRKLRTLDLSRTRIGDKGLAHLSSLKNLRTLNLAGTRIGDKGLQHISKLTGIRLLNLQETQVKNRGMLHLSKISRLQVLYLKGTKVGKTGLKALSKAGIVKKLPIKNGSWTTSTTCSPKSIEYFEWLYVKNHMLFYHEGGCEILRAKRIKNRKHSLDLCCWEDDVINGECASHKAVLTIHNNNSFSIDGMYLRGKHRYCSP